jgi:transposase
VVWWLLGRRQQRTVEETAFVERLTSQCPRIALAQSLVQEFFGLVRRREGASLEEWTAKVEQSGLPDLKSFCRGLRRDWDAVLAGLTLEWSNGPVEGQVHRLKMLKRQMYGRASFALLRVRVLPATRAA